MKNKIGLILLVGLLAFDCAKVPVTGRRQVNLLPESQLGEMSATAYGEFLSTTPPLPNSDPRAQKVRRVGERIAEATERYLKNNSGGKKIAEFDWTFNTVEDPTVNAWCMPGGRVVFYTGILPITKDEAGLAVVMGHEIAHAVARHGNERMSQGMAVQGAGMALDVLTSEQPDLTRALLMQSYGIGSTLGTLSFSRLHETEADKMGLIFMAMAGYDPREAPKFWIRMSEASGGGKPPEFLSTHPADDRRVADLEEFMPEAMKYYNQ
ncbi:MAG: M48 family metallopeptidase [Cryomorphaceae bacterium]|nr:M48 family metallopeptidase [Flavobacteriales bacterium]